MRQQALRDSQSDGEGSDTGKFDAKKEAKKDAKKEATKADAKRKSDAILTYRDVSLTQKALRETNSSGLGGGEESGTGGKNKNIGDEWVRVVGSIGDKLSYELLKFCVRRRGFSLEESRLDATAI